jgi:hypothetical protein
MKIGILCENQGEIYISYLNDHKLIISIYDRSHSEKKYRYQNLNNIFLRIVIFKLYLY